jgi:biofilm PGA synthesis N-glycosyltransferase PgaC
MVIAHTFLLISCYPDLMRYFNKSVHTDIYRHLPPRSLPPVSIVIPFYNERINVIEAILSVMRNDYHNIEIIAVNDASTDDTLSMLIDKFDLIRAPDIVRRVLPTQKIKQVYISKNYPQLMVIDKEHGGAGDGINLGINASTAPFFMTFDADSIMATNAISELMYPIIFSSHTIAVGGAVYILNNCLYKNGEMINSKMPYKLTPALQSNEYLRSHLFSRTSWNIFGGTVSYSGTATLFEKEVVIEAGGFDIDNFAQDAEIIMRLHSHMLKKGYPYKICFNPSSVVWTDVPGNLKEYIHQRSNWQRGMLRSVLRYDYLFFNKKFKLVGLFNYPMFIFTEIISVFVEFLAYMLVPIAFYYGVATLKIVILSMVLAWGFIAYITMGNALLSFITFNKYQGRGDMFWMLLLSVFEVFGFRQIYIFSRMLGTCRYVWNRLLGRPL